MTVTCPVCKKKFHKGKTDEFGRQSRHLWKEHPAYMKKKIKSGVRKRTKQLDAEFEYTDDMILQSLIDAGIPIKQPRQLPQQPMYQPIPYYGQPTEHESIAGALITAYKLGQTAYTAYKIAKPIAKKIKARKKK